MQTSELAAQAVAVLASLASRGVGVAQGVATRILSDLVAERLRRDGNAAAWEEFKRVPQNDSLVRHLLLQAMQEDADFASRLSEAFRAAVNERPGNSGQQVIGITGSGDAQIGDRGDTFSDSRVATRGGSYHEGDILNEGDQVTNKKNPAVFVVVAIVALVVIGLVAALAKGIPALVGQAHGEGLSARSTCQQFLNTDENTEQQALVDVAASKGIGGFGSPLALPEIRYECSFQPTTTLGNLVEKDKNEF